MAWVNQGRDFMFFFFFFYRLNPLITPPVEKSPIMSLSLQEVIIVGAYAEQIKFRYSSPLRSKA